MKKIGSRGFDWRISGLSTAFSVVSLGLIMITGIYDGWKDEEKERNQETR